MIVLLFFIFSALLLGSFHLGSISVRVIAAVVMIGFLFIHRKNTNRAPIKKAPIIIYTVFLAVSFLCKLISGAHTGVDEISPFATRLLAYFLLCYIAYFAIDRIAVSKKDIKLILILLSAICALNDIVTYLQYIGNPTGVGLGMLFSTSESEYLKNIADNLYRHDEFKTAMPGIFGHGAVNGYMVSCLGILGMYFLNGNGRKYWIIGIILFALSLVGAFCCQERSGFGLLIMFALISVWKFSAKYLKYSVPLLLILLGLAYYENIAEWISSQDIGRFAELTNFDDTRTKLVRNAVEFILNHPLLGGDVLYGKIFGLTPHNVILHSFIYSGLIGAALILYLTFYMLADTYRTIKNSHTGTAAYFFACALAIFLLNGFFHSSSLITGDVIIWILYACMLRGNQLDKTRYKS